MQDITAHIDNMTTHLFAKNCTKILHFIEILQNKLYMHSYHLNRLPILFINITIEELFMQ